MPTKIGGAFNATVRRIVTETSTLESSSCSRCCAWQRILIQCAAYQAYSGFTLPFVPPVLGDVGIGRKEGPPGVVFQQVPRWASMLRTASRYVRRSSMDTSMMPAFPFAGRTGAGPPKGRNGNTCPGPLGRGVAIAVGRPACFGCSSFRSCLQSGFRFQNKRFHYSAVDSKSLWTGEPSDNAA